MRPMAEEFRYFLRTAVWVVIAGIVYWLLSYEAAGTALLAFLLLALVAFIAVGVLMAGGGWPAADTGRPLAWLNRVVGFHERADARAPMEAGAELVPLSSAWPVVTAVAFVLVGLGFIFGPWLTVPGVALLLVGGIGWLTQLDAHR